MSTYNKNTNLPMTSFYHVTCVHSADYAVARCLSICLSLTCWYSVEMVIHIIKLFHCWVATPS